MSLKREFLYIDILGFSNMVQKQPCKIEKIFQIIDRLGVYKHHAFRTIVFSDTILVFKDDDNTPSHYNVTYLIEFAQELFYKLLSIGVYFKGLITSGEFIFKQMNNIQAYWGEALIETYNDADQLQGFGLFVNKRLSADIVVFDKLDTIDSKYDYVFLCQSYINLYKSTQGKLPIEIEKLYESDEYTRIDEDLRFFREIRYVKDNCTVYRIANKYLAVYMLYKNYTYPLFKQFENENFLPSVLNVDYIGNINPYDIIAEQEECNTDGISQK